VWAVFGNRTVVCYDLDGRLVWSDVLADNPQAMWGHSSSPLLVGDKLIVNIENTVAFEAATGRRAWLTKYGQSWGSAVHARIGSEDLILLANGRILRASDGKVLKRVPGLPNASPVVHDGVAYYIDVRAEAHELPTTLAAGADTLDLKTRWSIQLKGGDIFASSIVHDGLIYAVSTQQIMNVIDATSGQIVSTRRLTLGEQPVWPSLCLAGKYLYISSRDGTTLVLEAGRQYQEVARNRLEYFISTPVFHNNRMFVRTSQHLFCIGQQ
jgi:outer membrane protein assembly factor BamB